MTDFPTYNDIIGNKHRAWNRLNTYWNIKGLLGVDNARAYLEQFPKVEKKHILILGNYIVMKGYEHTRRELFRSLNNNSV